MDCLELDRSVDWQRDIRARDFDVIDGHVVGASGFDSR